MKHPYKSHNPNAGITTYELCDSAIILEFADGKYRYLYDENIPGREHVETMRLLAAEGKGLTTYVNQHVREHYAAKLPITRKKNPRRNP